MKKFILGLTIGILLTIPLFVFSASNLADRLKGKILLAVEDKGKTYYVHEDGFRYRITSATAKRIFEKLALGITDLDLLKIPLRDVGINPENNELYDCQWRVRECNKLRGKAEKALVELAENLNHSDECLQEIGYYDSMWVR